MYAARGRLYTAAVQRATTKDRGASRRRAAQRARALGAVEAWHARFDPQEAVARDPVEIVRSYPDNADRELVALLAALMAFGRVETIRAKLRSLLGLLGPHPAAAVRARSREELVAVLAGFRHRTFRGEDIAALLWAAGAVQARDGSLYASLAVAVQKAGSLREPLTAWVEALRALAWPAGLTRAARHLVPDPAGPSASKRLLLLMRWVARPDDGVDLGLAAIPTAALVMPLDVHIHRIARNLGFTARGDASWRTAEEVTEALRGLSADDPVRYDLAVCHLGIARRCPSARDPVRCEGCALQSVCVHWEG